VRIKTPKYGVAHVTKHNPIKANIGQRRPKLLNNFLTLVFDNLFSLIKLSPITLDKIIKSQKPI